MCVGYIYRYSAHSGDGSRPTSNRPICLLGATRVCLPNGISIASSVFAVLISVPNTRRQHSDKLQTTQRAKWLASNKPSSLCAACAGADLGFYKGGCPIHLKGAPPPPIILTHVTGTKQFFGLRRNSSRQAVVRHLELCQIPY